VEQEEQEEGQQKPVLWVVLALMATIAFLGWAFAAAAYATEHEDLWAAGRASRRAFLSNAIHQLPNASAVISYTLKERLWLPIVVAVLEVLAIAFGFVLKAVEREMPSQRRRKRLPGRPR